MAGELDITSGGAIAVDSEALREVGRRLGALGRQLADAGEQVRRAYHALVQAPSLQPHVDLPGMWHCADQLERLAAETADDAAGTTLMADVFEYVELRAEQQALAIGMPEEAAALQMRIDTLAESDPRVQDMAAMLVAGWAEARFAGMDDQFLDDILGQPAGVGADPVAHTLVSAGGVATFFGLGVIPYGTTLAGPAAPVKIAPVRTASAAAPPKSLEESLRRIPYGATGQVRVEKYTMVDGSRRFVTYIDGTRTLVPLTTDEPWDMGSNWDLYMHREQAASHHATVLALEAAGARPGDVVDLVSYSQGAAIGSHLAMDSPYEVRVNITAGSPVEPSLTDDQVLVQLRHTDDPVGGGLTGGGSYGGTGAPGSFTAWREAGGGPFDHPFVPHHYDEYLETARQVDASADPRVRQLDEYFDELGQAVDIQVMDFAAERP